VRTDLKMKKRTALSGFLIEFKLESEKWDFIH